MKYLLLVLTIFSSEMVFSTTINSTKITALMLDAQYGHKAYIKTSEPHISDSPDCHGSVWSFVLKVESDLSKTMYASLLAAYMSGKSVTLAGTDSCDSHNGIEDLRRVELL